MVHLPHTLRQLSAVGGEGALGDVPLIVLTAGQQMAPGSTPFDDRRVPVSGEALEAQRALAALSLQGEQRVIEASGHQVHLDAPYSTMITPSMPG
jgi:hypothetical protein